MVPSFFSPATIELVVVIGCLHYRQVALFSFYLCLAAYGNRLGRSLDRPAGYFRHGAEFRRANVAAGAALNTLALVDDMHHPFAALYRLDGASPGAAAAAGALAGVDVIGNERFAG
jgi:hypothetical protein